MKRNKKRYTLLSLLLFLGYGALVIYFLLFSDGFGRGQHYSTYRYNLHLFQEISRFILYYDQVPDGSALLNLLGNVLVFLPFGFLIPIWRSKKTGFWRILAYSFLFSLFIETTQLVTRVGVFDVDDLFLNTLGGVLGFLLWLGFRRIYRKRRE